MPQGDRSRHLLCQDGKRAGSWENRASQLKMCPPNLVSCCLGPKLFTPLPSPPEELGTAMLASHRSLGKGPVTLQSQDAGGKCPGCFLHGSYFPNCLCL